MIPIDHNKPRVDPLGLNVPPKPEPVEKTGNTDPARFEKPAPPELIRDPITGMWKDAPKEVEPKDKKTDWSKLHPPNWKGGVPDDNTKWAPPPENKPDPRRPKPEPIPHWQAPPNAAPTPSPVAPPVEEAPKTPAEVVQEHRASKEPMFPKPSGDMHQEEGYSKNEVAQRAMPSYLHKQLMKLGGYSPNPELRDKANKTIRQQQEKDSEEMGGSHWSKEDIAKLEAGRDEDLQKLDERENLIGDDNPAQEIFGKAIKGQTSRVNQQSHDSHRAGNGPSWEPRTAPGLIMGGEAPRGLKGGPGPIGGAIAAARTIAQVHKWLKKDPPPAKVPTKPVEPVEPKPVEPTPVEPVPNPKKDAYERIKKEKKERKERREKEDKEKEPNPLPDPVKVPPVPNPHKPVPKKPNPYKPVPKVPNPFKEPEPSEPNPFVPTIPTTPKPARRVHPKPTIPDRRVDPVPEPVPPVPVPDPVPKPVPKPKEDTTSTTETENKKSEGPHTETETETTTDTKTGLKPDTKPPPKKVETGEKEPKPTSPQNIPALMMPQGHVQSFPSMITGIPTHSAPSFEKTHLEINYYTELGF